MMHNYINDTNPHHLRDYNYPRAYRTSPSPHTSAHLSFPDPLPHHLHRPVPDILHRPSHYTQIPRTRPRGDDGRFVPRIDDEPPVDNRERKICGWCSTTSTSQWRVGPSSGSSRMGTLCNACGINYRRALAKSPGGVLNLDRLSEQMGHTRLSIQKALKRQRKQGSFPAAPFKRARPGTRPIERFTQRHYERYVYPSAPRFPASGTSPSTLTMLLDNGGPVGATPAPIRAQEHFAPIDSGVSAARSAPGGRFYGGGLGDGAQREESRLPPFHTFIGDLERRTSM